MTALARRWALIFIALLLAVGLRSFGHQLNYEWRGFLILIDVTVLVLALPEGK